MRIRVICPKCQATRQAAADWVGRKVRCNACGNLFLLQPTGDEPAELAGASSPIQQSSTEEKTSYAGVPMKSDPLKVEELVDMTAMVDVVFFLLIFFLVTAMQQIVSSMDMGESVAPSQTDRPGRPVAVANSNDQQLTIRIDCDDQIWIEDDHLLSEQDLYSRLRTAMKDGNEQILVVGHEEAHTFSLVNVLDAGYEVGFDNLQMSVLTEDDWQTQGL